MTRTNRALLAIIVAAGMCAPALAQPKDKAPEKKPTTTTTTPAAQPDKTKAPEGAPKMDLPPGMTAEDMQACMAAGTPGPNHEWLAKQAGTYKGKVKFWMTPEAPVNESTCITTITPIFDGKFLKVDSQGMMEMGGQSFPFHGNGFYGYDNTGKTFQSVWFDNMGSGMVTGTGTLSTDQKTLTLNEKMYCPLNKKEVSMRETWNFKPDGTMVLEMFGPDKTGKEFKSMEITYTDKTAAPTPAKPTGAADMKAKPSDGVPAKK